MYSLCFVFPVVVLRVSPDGVAGPASVTLYPSLIGKIRILIYNGDADSCVPYKGNAEWIADIEATGL